MLEWSKAALLKPHHVIDPAARVVKPDFCFQL